MLGRDDIARTVCPGRCDLVGGVMEAEAFHKPSKHDQRPTHGQASRTLLFHSIASYYMTVLSPCDYFAAV
jgi:hypothetical protein